MSNKIRVSKQFNYFLDIFFNFLKTGEFSYQNTRLREIDTDGARSSTKTYTCLTFIFLCLFYFDNRKWNITRIVNKEPIKMTVWGLRVQVYRWLSEGASDTMKEFIKVCQFYGIDFESDRYKKYVNHTTKTIKFKFTYKIGDIVRKIDNIVQFKSMKKSENKKSPKKVGADRSSRFKAEIRLCEEITEIEEHADYLSLIESEGGADSFLALSTSNPFDGNHWHPQKLGQILPYNLDEMKANLFQFTFDKDLGTIVHHNCIWSNEFLSDEDRLKYKYIENNYPYRARTSVWGQCGMETGTIFSDYSQFLTLERQGIINLGQNIETEEEFFIRICNKYKIDEFSVGFDYGLVNDPSVALLIGLGGREIDNKGKEYYTRVVVFWELYIRNSELADIDKFYDKDIAKHLFNKIMKCKGVFPYIFSDPLPIWCDPSCNSFQQTLKDVISIHQEYDSPIEVDSATRWVYDENKSMKFNSVERSIQEIRRIAEQGCLVFCIDFCPNLMKEWNTWRWKPKGDTEKRVPQDKNNHCLDALKYGLATNLDCIGDISIY